MYPSPRPGNQDTGEKQWPVRLTMTEQRWHMRITVQGSRRSFSSTAGPAIAQFLRRRLNTSPDSIA
jgi:hypothetical protein